MGFAESLLRIYRDRPTLDLSLCSTSGVQLLEFVNHADREHINVAFADRVLVTELAVTIKIAPDGEFRREAVGNTDTEGRLHFGRLVGCTGPRCLHSGVDKAEPAQQRDLVADRQHPEGR